MTIRRTGETADIRNSSRAKRAKPARPGRTARVALQLAALLWLNVGSLSANANASQLKPVTLGAFQHYVALTEDRMAGEMHGSNGFLWIDQLPPQQREAALAQLRQGQVITQRLETRENGQSIPIPFGMAHHWMALVFVPGVDLAQTIAEQKRFDEGADIYGPEIQRSKALQAGGNQFEVYYRLQRHVLFVSATFDANFDVQFFPLDAQREYSRSYSTRIAELIDAGTPDESEMPIGRDSGYLWRLNTYTRYQERDGGVYIQTEFIGLSRSVPAIFAWLINPYIHSIPQEYLTHILTATREDLMNPRETSAPRTITAATPPSPSRPGRASSPSVGAVVDGKSY